MGQYWVWKDRPTAVDDTVGRAAGDQLFRHLSLFHPIFERGEGIEVRKPRTSAAVMNPGNEKQPKEVLGLLAVAHELHHAFVIADRRSCHDRPIGPAVPHENLPTTSFERAQVNGSRVISSS